MEVSKRIRLTGPGSTHGHGHGQGCGRGKVPNQLLTSLETMKYVSEVEERTSKKEDVEKEKEEFVKKALAEKSKQERAQRKRKLIFKK